jgi:MFS family permease
MQLLKKSPIPLSAYSAFIALSVLTFFFSAQVSLTIYVDSSYLAHAIRETPSMSSMRMWSDPDHAVGTLYTIASLVTILMLVSAPKILRRHGNFRTTNTILIVHTLLLLGLSLFDSGWFIVPFFLLETAIVSTLYFNLDIFLERYSDDKKTGIVRGLFMVISSAAWLFPPMIAGQIIDNFGGFQEVYLLGAVLMIPTIFILMHWFSDFPDLTYDDAPLFMTHKESRAHPDIHNILMTNFFLHFFYAWMIIYTPLYFHNTLGMTYADFGLILTIALSAFVLFPYFAGWLADKLIGEKELLVVGFLLMALSSIFIPLLTNVSVSIALWATILFVGRTGAAIVETMAETYFFKKVDGHNAGLIGYFRRSRPMAFIVAPIIASALLESNIVTMADLFYILSGIMILALFFPLRLVDTK